jgi:hypothetical protein
VAIAKAKAEDKVALDKENWFQKIPVQPRGQLTSAKGFTTKLMDLADRFDALGETNEAAAKDSELGKLSPGLAGWGQWQTGKFIAGTEENKLRSLLLTLVPTTARLMGEVGNLAQNEQERVISATLGNITSSPKDIAGRLRELARLNQDLVLNKMKDWKAGLTQGGDTVLNDLATLQAKPISAPTPAPSVPTVGETFNGQKVISVRKIK